MYRRLIMRTSRTAPTQISAHDLECVAAEPDAVDESDGGLVTPNTEVRSECVGEQLYATIELTATIDNSVISREAITANRLRLQIIASSYHSDPISLGLNRREWAIPPENKRN